MPVDLREAVIADMDGTIADVSSARHLINGPGGFHAFHRASINCPPNQWVIEELRAHAAAGRAVLQVTAREAVPLFRHVTAWYLALHAVPSEAMWMRARWDYRPDPVVKAEILAKIRRSYPNVVRAYEDQPEIAERVWLPAGIPTVLVPGWTGRANRPSSCLCRK